MAFEFGNIVPGQISECRPFQMAYRRPHIELEIDGGNYTYEIASNLENTTRYNLLNKKINELHSQILKSHT